MRVESPKCVCLATSLATWKTCLGGVIATPPTSQQAGHNGLPPQQPCAYRAGYKLEAALDHLELDVHGLRALDAGISTGGFSDCLLQRGVSCLIGVDVGYGQVLLPVLTRLQHHSSSLWGAENGCP